MYSSRMQMYNLICKYYEGEIDNFELEDLFPSTDDLLIMEIIKSFWYFYDDTRRHLWFEFYNYEIQVSVSVWLFFLQTDLLWKDIIKDIGTEKEQSVNWQAIYDANKQQKGFVLYMPCVTFSLVTKMMDMQGFWGTLFTSHWVKQKINLLRSAIALRDEVECRKTWEHSGFNYNKVVETLYKNVPQYSIDTELISKMLPEDNYAFVFSKSTLEKKIFDFLKKKNTDLRVIDIIKSE